MFVAPNSMNRIKQLNYITIHNLASTWATTWKKYESPGEKSIPANAYREPDGKTHGKTPFSRSHKMTGEDRWTMSISVSVVDLPPEKSWTTCQLGWWNSQYIYIYMESHNPAMFQSPPTRFLVATSGFLEGKSSMDFGGFLQQTMFDFY